MLVFVAVVHPEMGMCRIKCFAFKNVIFLFYWYQNSVRDYIKMQNISWFPMVLYCFPIENEVYSSTGSFEVLEGRQKDEKISHGKNELV